MMTGQVSSLLIPWATYTDPEVPLNRLDFKNQSRCATKVAHIGEYEHDLKARNVDYDVYKREFKDVDRSIVDSDTEGCIRVDEKANKSHFLNNL